jgi:amidase
MPTQLDEHVAKQAERQADARRIPSRPELDFTPFQGAPAMLADLDLRAASVAEMVAALKAGRLTSSALVAYCIERARQLNGRLHCILELNPDAMLIARDLDEELRAGKWRGPLHGIPVLLKDNVATADAMSTTAGAAALAGLRAVHDATLAARLRAAGAVLLGKASLSEWANYMTTNSVNGFSALGGFTHNPYGPFDVGGSSSGSAASVAAGIVPLAVGSETCGSITSPASANSVLGLKPSLGFVSRAGMIPITDELDTAGPMARSVADAAVLMSVLAGPDEQDPATAGAPRVTDWMARLTPHALRGKRVGRLLDFTGARDGDEEAAAHAVSTLRAAGAEVVDIELAFQGKSFLPLLDYGLREGVNAYLAVQAPEASVRTLEDVIAFNKQDPEGCAPFGQDILERSQACPLVESEYRALALELRANAAEAIDGALRAHRLDFLFALNNYSAGVYAVAGYPALTIPGLYRANGEPVGATLLGTRYSDPDLLAAGFAFEQHHPKRQEPSL